MIKPRLSDDPKGYLSQIITNLQSSSKNGRKQALQKMKYEIFDNSLNDDSDLTVVFPVVHTYILKSFADDSEACREQAIHIIAGFIDTLPLNDFYLTYIMPVLVRRIGCPEIVEESEELRLLLITLVRNIVEKYKSTTLLVPFFNDFLCILTKTCMDPYPKVKREACETVILISNVLKRDFHMQSESFVKPTLSNFSHQHFRVRVTAIQCIGAIVMNGNAKCFEESISPMAEKLFDESSQVRMQVTREIGNWMLSLRDRYSYWHRMIPLLLTCLSDAIADIRTEADNLWKSIGLQYMDENEEELKKKTDFLTDVPSHYPDVVRPNVGCRTLVQRNIGKIVPAIARELDGWQSDARLRSSQLLCWLILCAEEGSTQHSNTIVRALLRGAKDDDTRVTIEIKRAAELFGYFIAPETWWPLIRPELESWGSLFVVANVLKGTHPSCLNSVYLKEIVRELVDPDRCQTRKKNYQLNLLRVTEALMDVFKEDCNIVYDQIFIICFTVYAMAFDNDTQFHAFSNLDKLRYLEKCGKNITNLYDKHIHKILSSITSEASTWTLVSADRCLLQAVMQIAGSALAHNLHLLAPLLKESVASDVDAEVKLKVFTGLSSVMLKKQTAFEKTDTDKLEAFLRIVLQEVIMPNLVWTPGRTAEAIRTAALACLCSVLQSNDLDGDKLTINESGDVNEHGEKLVVLFPSKEVLEPFLTEILPLTTSLVDDNSHLMRQYALRALRSLALLAQDKGCFTPNVLNKTYFVVLKRLDDSNEKVRSFAVQTLCTFFKKLPEDYDLVTSNAHIDALYSAMLIHLDDVEESFRKEMLDALLELSSVDPKLLKRKVHANMQLYRNKAAYEKLVHHLDKMSLSK